MLSDPASHLQRVLQTHVCMSPGGKCGESPHGFARRHTRLANSVNGNGSDINQRMPENGVLGHHTGGPVEAQTVSRRTRRVTMGLGLRKKGALSDPESLGGSSVTCQPFHTSQRGPTCSQGRAVSTATTLSATLHQNVPAPEPAGSYLCAGKEVVLPEKQTVEPPVPGVPVCPSRQVALANLPTVH